MSTGVSNSAAAFIGCQRNSLRVLITRGRLWQRKLLGCFLREIELSMLML